MSSRFTVTGAKMEEIKQERRSENAWRARPIAGRGSERRCAAAHTEENAAPKGLGSAY